VRAIYRIKQGIDNLTASMQPEDWSLVTRWLSPVERSLFSMMQRPDQLHCTRVARWLLDRGETNTQLIKAALLHDVGKSRCYIGVQHRTLYVLLGWLFRIFPPLFAGPPGENRWWMPYYVIANHSRIGASMLAQSGCEERVWRLVELHQQDPQLIGHLNDGPWIRSALERLRLADGHN
jgi:putative nucleotidyltransferase with HDIG domain